MHRSIFETDIRYSRFISRRNYREVFPQKQLEILKARVLAFPAGKLIFDRPVVVKKSPDIELFNCYGVWADKQNGVWLMDGQGQWHEIRHDQANAEYVITSVNHRVKSLRHERNKVLSEC